MTSQKIGGKRSKPDGGYCSASSITLGLLWWCLSEGLISLRAVRVGLALFELRIRRAAFVWTEKKAGRGAPEFTPHYSPAELAALCGLPVRRARAALRELLDLGLLAEFSPEEIRFARSVSDTGLSPEQRSAFRSWHEALTKRRRIPIPRRAFLLACESSSRALIAVILGVCLRCSWLRPGEGYSGSGRVSCQWLARRFRLSLRAIQGAKEHLVGLGWLERTGNINRLGEVVAINPAWHRLLVLAETQGTDGAGGEEAAPSAGTNPAGAEGPAGTNPAGLSFTPENPPSETKSKYQRESAGLQAAAKPGPGISPRDGGQKTQDRPGPALPPPRLSQIRPEDLRSTERLIGDRGLFGQAVRARLLADCEADQLYFVACAERARTAEVRNPCGVFNVLMKDRRRFSTFISAEQEDAARRRIREWRNAQASGGVPFLVPQPPARPLPAEPAAPRLSKDAELVRTLRLELARRGCEASVFAALRAHAGWDRDRYAAAIRELAADQPVAANAV